MRLNGAIHVDSLARFPCLYPLQVVDLWAILGDRTVPLLVFAYHVAARAVALIAVPVAIYLLAFYVHFQ